MKDMQPGGPAGMGEAQLDSLCRDWLGVQAGTKWEFEQVYQVCGKMFVARTMIGPDRGRISFRVQPRDFVRLCEREGFSTAPYSGLMFWVSVADPRQLDEAELAGLVRGSYEQVVAGLSAQQRLQLGV